MLLAQMKQQWHQHRLYTYYHKSLLFHRFSYHIPERTLLYTKESWSGILTDNRLDFEVELVEYWLVGMSRSRIQHYPEHMLCSYY
jgi:hypothetical protein